MALINSKWRKDSGDTLVNGLLRIAGAGVTALILRKVTSEEFQGTDNIRKTIATVSPALWTAMGVAGDLFLASNNAKAFCQGAYTFGALKTVSQLIEGSGNYMGLKGVESMPKILNGLKGSPIMNGVHGCSGTPAAIPPATFAKVAQNVQKTTAANTASTGRSIGEIANAMLINN